MTDVAARHGYAGASVSRVIEPAGVARATFYRYFPNRGACFLAAYRREADRIVVAIRKAATSNVPAERPRAVLEALLAETETRPMAANLALIQSLGGPSEVRREHERFLQGMEEVIERLLGDEGPGQMELQIPVCALLGGFIGVVSSRLSLGRIGELPGLRGPLFRWLDSYRLPPGGRRWKEEDWRSSGRRLTSLEAEDRGDAPPALLPRGRSALDAAAAAADRRDRILAATVRLVAARGYTRLTVGDIIAAARVPRRAFYAQFSGKEEAFLAAQTVALQGSIAAAASEFALHGEWPERVWRAGAAFLSYHARNPELSYLGIVEPYAVGRAAIRRQQEARLAYTIFLEDGYRAAEGRGSPPRLASEAIGWAVFALTRRQAARAEIAQMPTLLPQVVYLILAPFIGPEAASEFVAAKAAEAPAAA